MMKKILAAVTAVMLLLCMVFSSFAADVSSLQKELQKRQKEKQAVTAQKKEAQKTLLNDQKVRQDIIAQLEEKGYEKSQIEARIKDIEEAIKTLDEAIAQVEEERDEQLKLFQERLVVLYVNARTNASMDELLSSDNFDQMFKKAHMMQMVSKFDQDLIKSIENKQKEIEELKELKQREEENALQQLEESLRQIEELEVSRAAAEDRIAKSQQSVAAWEKAEKELEKEAQELTEIIKRASSTGTKYTGGVMTWPTPGYYGISSPFGYRIHPILKYRKFHGGVDINAPMSANIVAASSGTVIWSGWRSGGSGNTVIIDHGGGVTTLYLHIKNGGLLVKEGQKVKAGQTIAKVGSTGLSTGPHLHFEVRINGERQDPMKYISKPK
ncbi:MAG: peptidoglycan DD-metalloendopeptidase family protein [Clostridiaceae bacterium]|nr:peptidoglycan DD-metalloendopeptidase family protein [Clostridiaceae bacterium]